MDPTTRLASGQILAALEEISVVVGKCLGWKISKLIRDIIREHTAWEKRPWQQAGPTLSDPAFWRYFASKSRVYWKIVIE